MQFSSHIFSSPKMGTLHTQHYDNICMRRMCVSIYRKDLNAINLFFKLLQKWTLLYTLMHTFPFSVRSCTLLHRCRVRLWCASYKTNSRVSKKNTTYQSRGEEQHKRHKMVFLCTLLRYSLCLSDECAVAFLKRIGRIIRELLLSKFMRN